MPTTSNFGWTTPADTDLVKDGAAAIRTLGNGIDTSFLDLKGGTTNQVLAKNSNTDLDFKWVADASGIPATIFDAKGDIIAATAADTADRLAVGANNTVLTADSSTATGLKWAAPSAAAFVGVQASNGAITTGAGGNTNITFDTEGWDTDSFHSTSSNTQNFTIPSGKGGKYLFTLGIFWNTGNGVREVYVRKNSSAFRRYDCLTTNNTNSQIIAEVYNLTAGDVIFSEVYNISANTIGNAFCTFTYLGA